MTHPVVSVIIPNYNHARFLPQRIESVMGQTWRDMEVIILDDASTDNSREVIERYRGDPRVVIEYNAQNSGCVFKQWNRGLRQATGEYVWIAESDDYADRSFLETLVATFQKNPSVGVAFCQSYAVEEGKDLKSFAWYYEEQRARWEKGFVCHGEEEVTRHMLFRNTIPSASAALFRRAHAMEVGLAAEDFTLCGDWMFWVSCSASPTLLIYQRPSIIFVVTPRQCEAAPVRTECFWMRPTGSSVTFSNTGGLNLPI